MDGPDASDMGPGSEGNIPQHWRCIIMGRSEVGGAGPRRHIRFRARTAGGGRPPQDIEFRYSQLDRLRGRLATVADLAGLDLPRLPPKFTLGSLLRGRFSESFLDERTVLLQQFLDELSDKLAAHYADVGDFSELCEPIGEFIERTSQAYATGEIDAAAARAATQERGDLIATQDAEYEESLRADELKQITEAERAEAERRAAISHEEAVARAAAEAQAREDERSFKRAAFEASWPAPAPGTAMAAIRVRAARGAVLTRSFPADMPVSALFEYAAVADWQGAPVGGFDLRTSLPVRGLRGCEEQSLQEAGLCPSAALVLAEDESP